MSKRRFNLQLECSATIELDDVVIDAVDDEWRSVFYQLQTPEQIAEHIGYNLIVNNARLAIMDGFADLDDDDARVVSGPDWTIDASEAK